MMHYLPEFSALLLYVAILFAIGFFVSRRVKTATDFMMGGRSLNFWVTALSAHASDMSSWLFMGYPTVVFNQGLFLGWWLAVGLIFFMFLNWTLIAPRVRMRTEEYNSFTFSSFFESRFADTSGLIRIFTAILSLVFYTIYISAGMMGLGFLIESLFEINYYIGISIGVFMVLPYLFFGGYRAIAYIDLFQGFFLLLAICLVPLFAIGKVGGISQAIEGITHYNRSFSILPDFSKSTLLTILFSIGFWGLGYFGQPHIVTKFMGIAKVSDMKKSMRVGMSWLTLILAAAICIGLIGISFFEGHLDNPQLIFVLMVKELFSPFFIALILCAILAATISTMDSQILVLASSLTEDFYKRIFRKNASSKELIKISRFFLLLVSIVSYGIAFSRSNTIYQLVTFAWSGLGSSFGPLLLFSLFSKKTTKYGAWAGIVTGGIIAILWPYLQRSFRTEMPTLFPGFFLSSLAIWVISKLTFSKQN